MPKQPSVPDPDPEAFIDDYSEPNEPDGESVPEETPSPENPAAWAASPADSGFSAYDPMAVAPSRFDPVDEEGRLDLTSGRPRLVNEDGEVLPEFDEKWREDFHGLTFLGALNHRFSWMGHQFLIRTITVDEALNVALLTKAYSETIGAGLAYRTAVAALCVQQIDGKDLPLPLGESDDYAYAQQRFDYAKARWFQFTIDAIYQRFLDLETKVREVVEAMGKALGQTDSTSG